MKISTHLLRLESRIRLVSWSAVDAGFTGFAALLIIHLSSSKIVIFQKNDVVNGIWMELEVWLKTYFRKGDT